MALVTDAEPVRRTSTLSASSAGEDSTDTGPSSTPSTNTQLCAPRTDMVLGYNPLDGIQGLTQLQVKSLMLQMSFALTSYNYNAIDSYNRIGKYLLNSALLVNKFYLKEDYYEAYGSQGQSAAIHQGNAWTGKDSIYNLQDFFSAVDAQETVMFQLLNEYYDELLRIGGLKAQDKPGTIMGMLFVTHMSDAKTAQNWRVTGIGNDIGGTKLGTYYGLGRYAGLVLSSPTGIQ